MCGLRLRSSGYECQQLEIEARLKEVTETLDESYEKSQGIRDFKILVIPLFVGLRLFSSIIRTFSHISLSMMGVWAFSIYARLSFAVGMRFLLLKPKRVDLKLSVTPIYATFSRMDAIVAGSQLYGRSVFLQCRFLLTLCRLTG